MAGQSHIATQSSFRTTTSQSQSDLFTCDVAQLPVEFPARRSLAATPRCSLFGHRRQHLADVGGQQVVHLVALPRSLKVPVCYFGFSQLVYVAM